MGETMRTQEATGVMLCTDGVEACALRFSIEEMDFAIDSGCEGLEGMREWLVGQYNKYVTGEIPCSRCDPDIQLDAPDTSLFGRYDDG